MAITITQIEFLFSMKWSTLSINTSFFPLSSNPCIFKYYLKSTTFNSFNWAYRIIPSTFPTKSLSYFISTTYGYFLDLGLGINYYFTYSSIFVLVGLALGFLLPISYYYYLIGVGVGPNPPIVLISLPYP